MRFHYDKKEDAVYFRFQEDPYQESEEVDEGVIFDYNKEGKIIGIEILEASKKLPDKLKKEFQKKTLSLALSSS